MTIIRPETEMKESGASWMGKVPCRWSISKFKWYLRRTDPRNPGSKQVLSLYREYGVIPKDSRDDNHNATSEDTSKYKYVRVGDFVVNKMKAWQGSVAVSEYEGIVSPAYYVYHFTDDSYHKRYFHYLLRSCYKEEFMRLSGGIRVGQWDLSSNDLDNILVVIPKKEEQQAIADYLDETCSKIDEIIAEAKASINEYEKLKQATIDENIFGYDSVHIKLRQLGSLKNGLNFSHSDGVANIKFLGVGCFKDNMILSKVDDFADEHIDFEISEEYLLSNGDIVFVRSNGSKELVGRSIMVENIDYPVTFSGFCIRFRNMHTELVDNRFLLYYFRTTHFKQSLLKYSNDSTNINNLNQEMLNAIHINAPVINEQKLLVKKLEKQVFVIDSLITEKESLINDLEAYKKSLIYEVVTGKRRVV